MLSRLPPSTPLTKGEKTYLLCLFTGLLGGQRFYARRPISGVVILALSLLTGGVAGLAVLLWDAWKITHNRFTTYRNYNDQRGYKMQFLTKGKWPKSALLATGGVLAFIGASMASGGIAAIVIGAGMMAGGVSLAIIAAKRFFSERRIRRSAFNPNTTPLPINGTQVYVTQELQSRPNPNSNNGYPPAPIPSNTTPPAPTYAYNEPLTYDYDHPSYKR
jgi:TM2 domain-containing membrane protein YozV